LNGKRIVKMPIYEYACASCHHHFECLQKMDADPVVQCPHCLKDSAERMVSAAGFQLKGTGWYATDFKNKTPNDKKESSAGKTSVASQTSEPSSTQSAPASTDSKSDKS
jgi:putative FmdB family regulatory protein